MYSLIYIFRKLWFLEMTPSGQNRFC